MELVHQGRLFDSAGLPLQGDFEVDVSLFDAATGGTPLWTDNYATTPFEAGYYTLRLGESTALVALPPRIRSL